ncbi:MAG: hypothetical protein ABSE16_16825 [Verrucomicrobiota bacterium]
MKAYRIRCSIISLMFLLSVSLASASELKSDEHNYAITVSNGWTVDFQNVAGFSINSPDNKKTITLLIHKVNDAMLESGAIAQFEQGLTQAGSQIVSSTNFTVSGVPAHETVYSIGKAPFASSSVTLLTVADGKLYELAGMHSGDDVTRDSDIQEAFASFHFLQPPKPPSASFVWRFGPLGVKVAILGVVIVGMLSLIRSRKT